MNISVLTFDSIDSTNTEALNHARAGADEGLCIVARQQTAGRGRHGRIWISEKDAGLYFSIVLRPKLDAQYLSLITLMAGIAVHDTLQELGLKPDIKWVNDIHIGGKKISGILAETTETEKGLAAVVGIGINISRSNFPSDLAASAISIDDLIDPPQTTQLAEILTKYLVYFYGMLQTENGPSEIIKEWSRRSTYFSGKYVRVRQNDATISGLTDGLEKNGSLRVRGDDGTITVIQTGDVESLRSLA